MHNSDTLEYIFISKVTANFLWKNCIYLGSYQFFTRKKYVQNKHKGNKAKTKSMKPKLLKTLPVGTLISFIGIYN